MCGLVLGGSARLESHLILFVGFETDGDAGLGEFRFHGGVPPTPFRDLFATLLRLAADVLQSGGQLQVLVHRELHEAAWPVVMAAAQPSGGGGVNVEARVVQRLVDLAQDVRFFAGQLYPVKGAPRLLFEVLAKRRPAVSDVLQPAHQGVRSARLVVGGGVEAGEVGRREATVLGRRVRLPDLLFQLDQPASLAALRRCLLGLGRNAQDLCVVLLARLGVEPAQRRGDPIRTEPVAVLVRASRGRAGMPSRLSPFAIDRSPRPSRYSAKPGHQQDPHNKITKDRA
jgi:hypothetical protein